MGTSIADCLVKLMDYVTQYLSTQECTIHWKPLKTYNSVLDESPETLVTYPVNPLTSTLNYLKLPMKLDKSVLDK
jgi:hypothetical protein